MDGYSKKKELRHDRHTVSLLSDHMVFAPKYRGKILTGDVAMVAEGIICKTCKELDIEINRKKIKRSIKQEIERGIPTS